MKGRAPLLIGALVGLALVMRLVHLHADPPMGLSSSRSIYNDGGAYALNARFRLLTGHWIAPGDNVCAQTPGYTLIAWLMFRIFGLGLIPLRGLSILGTMAALILISWWTRRAWGGAAALLTALILSTSYIFTMYGRLELIEGLLVGPVTAGVVAAAASVCWAENQWAHRMNEQALDTDPCTRPDRSKTASRSTEFHGAPIVLASLSALLLSGSYLIKPTSIVVAAAVVLFLAFSAWTGFYTRAGGEASGSAFIPNSRPLRPKTWLVAPFIAFIATTTILISLYVGLFYIPYHHLFAVYREAFRQNAQDLWDLRAPIVCLRVLTVPGIWDLRGLPLALLVVAGLSAVSRAAREAPMGAARSWGILMALWLFLGLLYFAPQTYRPSRFTVLFVPPAAALAARGCLWLWSTGKSVRGPGPAAGIAWLIYLAAAALVQLEYPPDRDLGKNQGLLLLLMSVWAATAWGRRREPLRPVIARAAGTLLTGILIVSGLVEYGVWALHPHESLVSSEQTSIRLIAKSPSAGDNWCMAAALMHDSPAYKIDWLPVTEGELRRLGVHYLIVDAQEDRMLELYAPLLKRSTLLCSERIGPYRIHILKTPW